MAEKKNAMEVAYRASMLPIGNYEDGSVAFPVVPQGLMDAYEAFGRFHRGESPQPQDAVLAGLAMAGTGFGGLGSKAASGAVNLGDRVTAKVLDRMYPNELMEARRIRHADEASHQSGIDNARGGNIANVNIAGEAPFEGFPVANDLFSNAPDAAPVGLLPAVANAGEQAPIRAYRGSQQWPHAADDMFWATTDPATAGTYARPNLGVPGEATQANIMPAEARFQNPLVVDAFNKAFDEIPVNQGALRGLQFPAGIDRTDTHTLARMAREAGHDGLAVHNVYDASVGPEFGTMKPATTIAALQRGTVKSPLDGSTLFSNPSSPVGLLPMDGEGANTNQTGQAMPNASFESALAQLQGILVDLDGDGKPDAVAQQPGPAMPQNAMAPEGVVSSVPPQANAMQPGSFPEMVANNPQGWGNAPPRHQPVWEREPDMYQGEARNIERPKQYTQMLDEMTPPVIPGAGALLAAAPRVAGLVAGGVGLAAMTGTEGEGTESPAQNLYKQQAALSQRLEAVRAKADAEEANGGRGRNWNALNSEVQSLSSELAGVNAMLKDETTRNSPERQQDIAKRAADLAAEEQKRQAATPFRERYPNAAGALPMAGLAIAGAIPGAMGAKKAVGSFFPGSYAGRMRAGIGEAEAAIASGDRNAMDISGRYLDNMVAEQPTAVSKGGNAMLAGASGGGLAAEANMFPDQYDAYNLPAGPEQTAAHDRALDPRNYLERGAIGTLTGLSGYKIGGLAPGRTADTARARALSGHMRDNPTAAAPVAPNVVTRVRGKDGVVRFHDEAGNFTSAPPAKK